MGTVGSLALRLGVLCALLGPARPRPPTPLQRLFAYSKVSKQRHFLWLTARNWEVTVRYRHAGYRSRLNITTEMAQELYASPEWRAVLPPAGDYPVYGDDFAPKLPRTCAPVLAYCGSPQLSIPAYPFSKWPEARLVPFNRFYAETAGMADGFFLLRQPKLFWRGNVNIHPFRKRLVAQYAGHPDFDVGGVFVGQQGQPLYATMADHARYRYLLDAPAMGYSGRLARLLLLGSVVLIVDRPWHHQEYWHPDFTPWVHFVPVKADGSDLLSNLALLRGNDTLAENIARVGTRRARELFAQPRRNAHFAAVLANYTRAYGTLD